jgi:myosin heavy subunit
LKKKNAKKAGGARKKEDKPDATDAESSNLVDTTDEKAEDIAPEPVEATSASPGADEEDEPAELPKAASGHGRKPSVAVESRLRSASFYRGAEGGPTSPGGGRVAGDIFREQAQRIEELERENKRLVGEVEDAETRWKKGEEELDELREGQGDVALAVERGKEADRLVSLHVAWHMLWAAKSIDISSQKAEVESLKRQLSHVQTQNSKSNRRTSTASPNQSSSVDDLNAQVASKSATIESLELEISNLNKQLADQTSKNNELQAQMSSLESSLQKAEQEASSTKMELSDLKKNLETASETAQKEGSDRTSAETRVAQMEAELGAANRKASDSISRAELLEKKIETLTQLHRDNDARNQARIQDQKKIEREAVELRTRVTGLSNENARLREADQRRRKTDLGSIEDSSVQELVDEERDRMAAKLRELEEENFELKRGVWRDRRTAMQPSIEEEHTSGFDDVDLSGNSLSAAKSAPRHSSFQDIINSGLSAFTGQTALPLRQATTTTAQPKARKQSLASLASLDDFEFDEDAFRKAQEEDAKRRIERVREVKRGLKNWEGWRADFVDVKAGWGGVFEV